MEVATAKLCSLLQLGPGFETSLGFDLFCYTDCTEFYMEQCFQASNSEILNECSSLESSLRTMHSMGLIHKDIKPENIMFSPSLSKCVFIDFGISHFVLESHHEKSETVCEGTLSFMSP